MKEKGDLRKLALKHERALNTFLREAWGQIPEERETKLKSLKAWGFDLLTGLRDGRDSIFVAEAGQHKVGETYEEEGERFEVRRVIEDLKGAKLRIRVELEDRRGVIRAYHRSAEGDDTLLFTLPAGELLLAYFRKRGFGKLVEAFHSSGLTTEFIQSRGQEGRAYAFDDLPAKWRRALKEAQNMLHDRVGVGRFSLVYFGPNKDGDDRYIVTWLLPTIHLFDLDVAEHLEKLLAALD
ncbi:TIGR00703 family protein [Pyrinomonas methylaliphatogenes]|uniref:TIGR00703 family protein n=1 Tax=Pyrinomonas methylaliphatogenes TaxID=454194 RepID=A0A0B6WV07_9BACT|nr:TIGR00703 family protein [Pyrinomonas methylaliphatogenes]CDM65108.1 TIGR00703 family protein [Pyrinomonas methylaliphatogenes]